MSTLSAGGPSRGVCAPRVVDYHLSRLDADAVLTFCADLWRARGFEVRIVDDVAVARRNGHTLTLFAVTGGRFSRRTPNRPVDVVVAPGGSRRAAALASDHGARLLTTADLHEMLRYAVDPADADALCERHLGARLTALSPPLRQRVQSRVHRLADVELPASTSVVAVVALLVLATGGFVAVGDAGDAGAVVGADAADGGAAGDSSVAAPETVTRTPVPSDGRFVGEDPENIGSLASVPGVGPDGVTNLTALVAAHDRALGEQSYTLWVDTFRPAEGIPGNPRTQRDTDIAVDGDRYLVTESLEQSDDRRVARVVYYDGTDWYVDDRSVDRPMMRWVDGSASDISVSPDPRSLRETLLTRYLDTPSTDVTERVRVGRSWRYRLEGEGRPPAFAVDQVSNYRYVAFVDERGFVHEATVEFTVVTEDGSYELRFEWTYGQLGATSVDEPDWVGEMRPAGGRATVMPASASAASNASSSGTVP